MLSESPIQRRSGTSKSPSPYGWSWLPLPAFALAVVVLAVLDLKQIFEPSWLMPTLNGLVFVGASVVSAFLAAQAYLAGGSRVARALGAATLTFGAACLAGSLLVGEGKLGAGVAAHNTLALISGAIHLAGAIDASFRQSSGSPRRPNLVRLVGEYAACLLLSVLITDLASMGKMPAFLTSHGTTPLRTAVLTTTVAEYLAAALLFALLDRYVRAGLLRWYCMGLALIALGLVGVTLARVGAPLSWVGRVTQALGQIYIVVGLTSHARRSKATSPGLALSHVFTQLEEALQRSEEQFRSVFRQSPIGIALAGLDGRIAQSNPAFQQMLGYSEGELLGKHYAEFTHPDDLANEVEDVKDLLAGARSSYEIEKRYVRKDGRVIWVRLTETVLLEQRRPIGALAMAEDITERKQAEEALRELEAHKREFYRRTILAATEGKLMICEPEEIMKAAGPALISMQIDSKPAMSEAMAETRRFAREAGMEAQRSYGFLGCVTEAAANVIKHANGGTLSLHRVGGDLFGVVADHGPGIGALELPNVALTRGYSTAGTLGMGYKLMLSFADQVYLATGPDGTTVGIRMAVVPVTSPRP